MAYELESENPKALIVRRLSLGSAELFFRRLGAIRAGVTVALALLLLAIGGFQYFSNLADTRIERA